MKNWLMRRTQSAPEELAAVLWSFVYFFALLSGCYVLRPIRDDMGLQLGVAWAAVAWSFGRRAEALQSEPSEYKARAGENGLATHP